jgi:hypothetical protein
VDVKKCPFLGIPVAIVETSSGHWMGRLATPLGGYTTQLFQTREQLECFLNTRNGKGPSPVQISVREAVPPPAPGDAEEAKAKMKGLDDAFQDSVARTARR